MVAKVPSNEELMSPEFWAQPEGSIGEESLQLIYAQVVASIRNELKDTPNIGILETMMAERTAFVYVNIRQREGQKGFATDRAYKELHQLWMSLVTELRKAKSETSNPEEVKQMVIGQVAVALDKALSGIDPAQGMKLREALAEALEGA